MLNNDHFVDTISRQRGPLMGIAIVWVFLFHTSAFNSTLFADICSKGYIGVDVFFFLSGLGLCYSLNKDSDIASFYKKRVVRILPTWVLILCMMHMLSIVTHLPHPYTPLQLMCYYTGIGYFLQPLFDNPVCVYYYEWYIPTLLVFYLSAPFIFKLRCRFLAGLIALTVAIALLLNHTSIGQFYYMSYTRVPVYILGFLFL